MNELEQSFKILGDRTKRNRRNERRAHTQRRHTITDDYDKEYSAIGNENAPAVVWLAISPMMTHISDWRFKIIVEPMVVPLASGTNAMSPARLELQDVSLKVDKKTKPTVKNKIPIKEKDMEAKPSYNPYGGRKDTTLDDNEGGRHNNDVLPVLNPEPPVPVDDSTDYEITPNPHKHQITPNPHTHVLNAGVTLYPSEFTDFRIFLDGRDFTAEFKAQHENWVQGNGMFPDTTVENYYDILQALEGLSDAEREPFLKQGYHQLEFRAQGIFSLKIRESKSNGFNN